MENKQVRYSVQQRTFINYLFIKFSHVKVYLRVEMIRNQFAATFPGFKIPCRRTMFNIRRKYLFHETMENRNKGSKAGPYRLVRAPENHERIRYIVLDEAAKPFDQSSNSGRRNELKISPTSWFRSLKDLDLSYYNRSR